MPESPYTVSDVMTHTVVAVGSKASFKEIVALMDEWKVSALPVLAGEGRVVGVVSEADLLPKEEFRDTDQGDMAERIKAEALTAGDLMSAPAVTVHADATVAEAARIMARRHVKRLPVVDGVGLLQGVVSRSDLLKVFLRPDEEIDQEIRHGVLNLLPPGDTLTASVDDGVVTLSGALPDRGLLPVIARAVRAVEGVVDVRLNVVYR
ncbi:CBS domain-containing protein [Streptomyces sp. XM83C]|jgi:CBS domain-containing protein|uniref:CBS domain-containing protein n=1 Tax=Streptomyces thermocoprophilus TaxID=78356 RepID=A0ABV5VJS4_9ACTN|nr:CBS domain-containing protein [Streptomyces sp. XM83C]MCK1819404.1 CBS domain-containing protein [Streptomyces sp. XM83C]